MSGVVIRAATPGDALPIADVHVRAWDVAYRGLMPDAVIDGLTRERRGAMWSEQLVAAAAGSVTLVAADAQGVVIGFCSLALPSRDDDLGPDAAEIVALYVDPASWRLGVGRALLAEARARLHGSSFAWLTLWVLAGNERARAFYERFGFEPDGTEFEHEPPGQERPTGLRAERFRAALG